MLALEIVPHYTQGVNPCKAQFWNLHFSAESLVLYADNICTGDTLGKATLRASDVCQRVASWRAKRGRQHFFLELVCAIRQTVKSTFTFIQGCVLLAKYCEQCSACVLIPGKLSGDGDDG